MTVAEVMKKAESGEGLTVTEIKIYQRHVKPVHHTYGKYGNLRLKYLEEKGRDWLIEDLPTYLHNIDKMADELYFSINERLSKNEEFKHTNDFLENVRRENAKKLLIEEEILNEIVYAD